MIEENADLNDHFVANLLVDGAVMVGIISTSVVADFAFTKVICEAAPNSPAVQIAGFFAGAIPSLVTIGLMSWPENVERMEKFSRRLTARILKKTL